MRTKSIFIGLVFIFGSTFLQAQKPELTPLQRVENELTVLEQKVLKSKDNKTAFDLIFFGKKSLSDLIEGFEYKGSDQMKIETLRLALYSIPGETIFTKKECPAYKAEMLTAFEPKAKTGKPEDKLVLLVWNILEKLCK